MKVSELTENQIKELTNEQVEKIVYGGVNLVNGTAQYGIILGGKPVVCKSRAKKGAELYNSKIVGKLIVTGGTQWESDFGLLSESNIMKQYLLAEGVPETDIIVECQSSTTIENMLYSALCMVHDDSDALDSCVIVTSYSHLKRALSMAKRLLPGQMKISGAFADCHFDFPGRWMNNEIITFRVSREIPIYQKFIKSGWMDDIEFD